MDGMRVSAESQLDFTPTLYRLLKIAMNLVALQAAYDDSVRYLGSSGYTANLECTSLLQICFTAERNLTEYDRLGSKHRAPGKSTETLRHSKACQGRLYWLG